MSSPVAVTAVSRQHRNARERGLLLLLGLAGAVLTLAAGAPGWLAAAVSTATGSTQVLADGRTVAPVATAAALVALAAVIAASLGRRLGRTVAAVALIVAGAGAVTASLSAVTAPAATLAPQARAVSGRSTAQVSGAVHVAAWPYLSAAGGVVIAAGGAGIAVRGRRWGNVARYERDAAVSTAPAPADDPAAAWDSLTHGDDPTR